MKRFDGDLVFDRWSEPHDRAPRLLYARAESACGMMCAAPEGPGLKANFSDLKLELG
jgi:regulation of enolase protein 1 (concanavalin A-like superfamily)